MNRKEIKDFLETLHFHGYIDHDITKLDNLIDDYYPNQLQQADVSGSLPQKLQEIIDNHREDGYWIKGELRKLLSGNDH